MSDGITLDNYRKYRIAAYQTWADDAFEGERFEVAGQLYNRALDEIDAYRENITEIREEAELDEQDRETLQEMEEEITDLERGIEDRLEEIEQ
jgi:DNA-binding transcriptional regulator GbsR (MarR family)